jgi:hypothetical protein
VNSLRFQVLALASVVVALVLGALIGTGVRHSPAASPVRDQVDALQASNQALQDQLRQLTGSASGPSSDVVDQLAPAVLGHQLDGVNVLILSTASGADAVSGIARMLDLAGASEAGRLQVSDAFADPAQADDLLDLATASLPPSVSGGLPDTSDGVVAASSLLADVLLSHSVTADDRRSVLTAYASQGYLSGADTVHGPADAVIVVTGGPDSHSAAWLTLADQLHQAGIVVVGSNGTQSTVVGQVRGDSQLSTSVSTVDDVGAQVGQLLTVWAVADARAGHTGGFGSVGLPPALAPPAPASSASAPADAAPTAGPTPTATTAG